MQALMQSVYDAVMEFYDHKKPWKQDFVKFTVKFDEQGRVVAITYTPFPAECRDALLERVRDVCQPNGKDLTGELVNVVVGRTRTGTSGNRPTSFLLCCLDVVYV
jgi:hypothetical protein